jgi:hypothetical protein
MTFSRPALAAAGLLLGCAVPTASGCTLLGCTGTLTVTFDAPPATAYHIRALSVSDGSRDVDCPDPAKCPTVSLSGYTPDKIVLIVSTAAGSREFNLAPQYVNRYANGPHCGVTCRSATITVSLP